VNAEAGRLVTAFDVHATLVDMTRLGGDRLPRAVSLLNEVREDRTCPDADIAPHWCACLSWRPLGAAHWCACLSWRRLAVDSVPVQRAAQRVVDAINAITAPHRSRCHCSHRYVHDQIFWLPWLRCFDTVGWASGRASGL